MGHIWEQQWGMHARIHGPYMGAAIGHACAHTWATWEQQWGMHARIHGPYMGAVMGYVCAYIWPYMGQPYRESREEGNSRESLPFLRPGKGIALGLSFPFPTPSSREGKGREGNPYPIPQRSLKYTG